MIIVLSCRDLSFSESVEQLELSLCLMSCLEDDGIDSEMALSRSRLQTDQLPLSSVLPS